MQYYKTVTTRVTNDIAADAEPARVHGNANVIENAGDYGLQLFRSGRTREAMPLLERAAEAGDARALYVCATALFNGDHLPCDVARAFELMRRASDAGLPQAIESLAQMRAIVGSAAGVEHSANSVAVVEPHDNPAADGLEPLVSTAAIAKARAALAILPARPPAPAHAADTLGGLIQAMLADELRERLEVMLPRSVEAAVASLQVVLNADRS